MNESARQGLFLIGAIVIPVVMIGILHTSVYESLIIIGLGGIIMKLTDIQDTIRERI